MKRFPVSRRVALAAAVLLLIPVVVAGSTRNYLTVEGRVSDRHGTPLPGAWVYCIGSRRASVQVDSLGGYSLEIPGATLEELEQTPLKIRLQARHKGYRFALSNGAPEMGLEMRVVRDATRFARLRVRSNDGGAVAAVANSVVLDASPRALIEATFVGSPGAEYDTPPAPLDESDEIMLAGDSPSIPELAATETPSAASPAKAPAAKSEPVITVIRPPSDPVTTSTPPALEMNGTAAPPSSATESKPQASAPAIQPKSKPKRQPKVHAPIVTPARPDPTVAVPTTEAQPPSDGGGSRKWNAAGSDREESRPLVFRPALDPPAKQSGRERKKSKKQSDDEAVALSDAAPGPSATTAPIPSPATPPAASRNTPQAQSRGGGEAAATRAPSAPASDPSLRPVLTRDMPAERVTPGMPLPAERVPSAPGTSPAPRRVPGGSSTTPLCDCTIRGTVEVQSDRPLTGRTEVVISMEDTSDAAASVELFMGSPRAFEIHPSPCGNHRLMLWTRSRQRFVLVSAEPRVACTPGGVQQMRLVLEPIARWGAAQ